MNKHTVSRWDTGIIKDYEDCKSISKIFSKSYKEYYTVLTVKDGYIATNKYDPRVEITDFSNINPLL